MKQLPRSDYGKYAEHLIRLDQDDRYCRFCSPLSDFAIKAYVERISPDDAIFVEYDEELRAIAAVQISVSYLPGETEDDETVVAEIGISVNKEARGRGLAKKLLERAVLYARNQGIERLETICLLSNRRMQDLVREIGMEVESHPDGRKAALDVPPPDFASLSNEAFANYVGIWDVSVKETRSHIANVFERISLPLSIWRSF